MSKFGDVHVAGRGTGGPRTFLALIGLGIAAMATALWFPHMPHARAISLDGGALLAIVGIALLNIELRNKSAGRHHRGDDI